MAVRSTRLGHLDSPAADGNGGGRLLFQPQVVAGPEHGRKGKGRKEREYAALENGHVFAPEAESPAGQARESRGHLTTGRRRDRGPIFPAFSL